MYILLIMVSFYPHAYFCKYIVYPHAFFCKCIVYRDSQIVSSFIIALHLRSSCNPTEIQIYYELGTCNKFWEPVPVAASLLGVLRAVANRQRSQPARQNGLRQGCPIHNVRLGPDDGASFQYFVHFCVTKNSKSSRRMSTFLPSHNAARPPLNN